MHKKDDRAITESTASGSASGLSGAQRDIGTKPDKTRPSETSSEALHSDDVPRLNQRDVSGSQSSYGSETVGGTDSK